jgi:hypothetical protein
MLTLRQIEVIRAVMVTGTIAGAARLPNVAAPGISRLMKHTEDMEVAMSPKVRRSAGAAIADEKCPL